MTPPFERKFIPEQWRCHKLSINRLKVKENKKLINTKRNYPSTERKFIPETMAVVIHISPCTKINRLRFIVTLISIRQHWYIKNGGGELNCITYESIPRITQFLMRPLIHSLIF